MMSSPSGEPTAGSRSSDDVEVAVIGAGQAGLAIGHFLRSRGRRFAILERAGGIAVAWRERTWKAGLSSSKGGIGTMGSVGEVIISGLLATDACSQPILHPYCRNACGTAPGF